jgi:hypothetical protein
MSVHSRNTFISELNIWNSTLRYLDPTMLTVLSGVPSQRKWNGIITEFLLSGICLLNDKWVLSIFLMGFHVDITHFSALEVCTSLHTMLIWEADKGYRGANYPHVIEVPWNVSGLTYISMLASAPSATIYKRLFIRLRIHSCAWEQLEPWL